MKAEKRLFWGYFANDCTTIWDLYPSYGRNLLESIANCIVTIHSYVSKRDNQVYPQGTWPVLWAG